MVLFNHSDVDAKLKRGDKVAQMVIERISMPNLRQVKDLKITKRGERCFGSTD